MNNNTRRLSIHSFFIVALAIYLGSAGAIFNALDVEPSAVTFLASWVATLWALASWLKEDSRSHGIKLPFDFGIFIYIAWPVYLPVYLFKTRGLKGLIPILVVLATYILSAFLGQIIVGLVSK